MIFSDFDPLAAKQTTDNEVAINALKREIVNILDSYVGWYDPFCELIQNALDSVEERVRENISSYSPSISIIINLKDNLLIVTDNGIGLTKDKYEQFLAPSFSFKSGNTRGNKGVGATYLAYGFNYIQICTNTDDFTVVGKMIDARKWLSDTNPPGNPKVVHDKEGPADSNFNKIDKGVSIAIKFDSTTRPGNLSWLQAMSAEQWYKILTIKTGLGSVIEHSPIQILVTVINNDGKSSNLEKNSTSYFWPHLIVKKSQSLSSITKKESALFENKGANFKMPAVMNNLDCIYETISASELSNYIELDEIELEILESNNPFVYFAYMYSTKVWISINESLGVRSGYSAMLPGVQIAANNMPQGEVIEIPLKRNIGRQNQIHVIIHFDNCSADLGRKGFQKEIVEFSKSISRKLIEGPISRSRKYLRPVTGSKSDLEREQLVDDWKEEFKKHEKENPLVINNDSFFNPLNRVSITSKPTREQDVIAFFNQLLAGGVIRGIQIMATNERFTYDSMYRIVFDTPDENLIYNELDNPLGVSEEALKSEFRSSPRILEYKYSLNALIEDISSGVKNSNDMDLVVVWETGDDYLGNYEITSLLDPDNLTERQYHGITHVMTNTTTGQREMDLIVLEELHLYLNDRDKELSRQKKKYDIP